MNIYSYELLRQRTGKDGIIQYYINVIIKFVVVYSMT